MGSGASLSEEVGARVTKDQALAVAGELREKGQLGVVDCDSVWEGLAGTSDSVKRADWNSMVAAPGGLVNFKRPPTSEADLKDLSGDVYTGSMWDELERSGEGTVTLPEWQRVLDAHGAVDYNDADCFAIESLVKRGDVALLKREWVIALAKEAAEGGGATIPRRQDIPADAFWDPAEFRFGAYQIVSLSYPWHTPDHPDPTGTTLRSVAAFLENYRKGDFGPPLPMALFWDFASLPQRPRTPAEDVAFHRALRTMGVWYAHESTEVWMATADVPPDTAPYAERGWCGFESCCAGLATSTRYLLNLGKSSAEELGAASAWSETERKCAAARPPPRLPAQFEAELAGRAFTNGADREIVARLYAATFRDVLGTLRAMRRTDLEWTPSDFEQLAAVLPHCLVLTDLFVGVNEIGDVGAKAVAAAVAKHPTIDHVNMQSGGIGREGAEAIAAMVRANPRVVWMCVSDNPAMGEDGKALVLAAWSEGGRRDEKALLI